MTSNAAGLGRDSGVLAVIALVVAQTVLHLANRVTVRSSLLDANMEGTPFAAVSALLVAAAAAGCAVAAVTGAMRARMAVPLAGMLAFLALDEWFKLHERVVWHALELLGLSESWDSVVWPAVYLPLTGSVALLVLRVSRQAEPRIAGLLRVGLALLVTAVALEVVSAPFSTATTAAGLVHLLEGAVEEGCELAGWGLIALGVSRLAARGPAGPRRWHGPWREEGSRPRRGDREVIERSLGGRAHQ